MTFMQYGVLPEYMEKCLTIISGGQCLTVYATDHDTVRIYPPLCKPMTSIYQSTQLVKLNEYVD